MQKSKVKDQEQDLENTKQQVKKTAPAKLVVYNMQGAKIEEIDSAFGGPVNQALVSQAVKMYLANKRCGLAQTKTRGEVSGGGKKPWKQKGTGRARAGSTRSPLWRHGGVVFGPHPRDYGYGLSPKILNGALLSALNDRALNDGILVLDKLEIASAKAKEMRAVLDNLKLKKKILLVANQHEKGVVLSSRNIQGLSLALAKDLNALDVLKASTVVLLRSSLDVLKNRLFPAGNK